MSDRTLRNRLKKAKDPKEAARILGTSLAVRGKEVGEEVKDWLDSPEMQERLEDGKEFLMEGAQKVGEMAQEAAMTVVEKVQDELPWRQGKRRRK